MISFVFGNSLWQLIKQTDIVTKFVLLTLLLLSIVCWTIFFYKIILLRIKRRQIRLVWSEIREASTLGQLVNIASSRSKTLPGYYLSKVVAHFKAFIAFDDSRHVLTSVECDFVQNNVFQSVDEIVIQEESYLSILATVAAAAPLIGLFGTVWGLVHSFVRISELQTADIAVVAPGIAEALITTLAGLMVAIPVLFMYSYVSSRIRSLERDMLKIAERVSLIVQRMCKKL